MQRPPDIPQRPGVFALLHAKSMQAYVNTAGDLRVRATIWAHHLKKSDTDPGHPMRVRNWPRYPSNEWQFWFVTHDAPATVVEAMKADFANKGWKLISGRSPGRTYYTVNGVSDTLLGHCRRLGIARWASVYKRVERGETAEQALGITARAALDPRERMISQMRVKILTDDGEGYLTFDEAVTMRPSLGDVRTRIRRMVKKNPQLMAVKLSEIEI